MLLLLASLARAEDAWTTSAVELHRWPADIQPNPVVKTVGPATMVEVVARQGAETRVRVGGDFGWVPSSSLTLEAPAPSPPSTPPPAD